MDWCGHQVLASAIDMRIFVEAERTDGDVVEAFSYPPFTRQDKFSTKKTTMNRGSDLRYVGGVLAAFNKRRDLPYEVRGTMLHFLKAEEARKRQRLGSLENVMIDLPAQKGLSSSAAMCVAISAAIDLIHRFQMPVPQNMCPINEHVSKSETITFYADMAYSGERKELGVNCGQMDPYASAFGGILHIDCAQEPAKVSRLKPKTELPLVIGDTKQPKDAPKILAWLGERFKAEEPVFMEGMKNIVKIVDEARKELEKPSPNRHRIGELMNENQHYIRNHLQVSGDCPISPSRLDKLIDAVLHAGALGAKVSGSGGGGCMIALCEPGDETKVANAINKEGGEAYITKVPDKGVRVEFAET
jgi:mevalonate kinase